MSNVGYAAAVGFLALTLYAIATPSEARKRVVPTEVKALSASQRSELESLIASEVEAVLPLLDLKEGQQIPQSVQVTFDPESSIVYVELGLQFLPTRRRYLQDMDEQIQHITNTVVTTVGNDIRLRGVSVTYAGREAYHYYPPEPKSPTRSGARASGETSHNVGISAGHGLYYHHVLGSTEQRERPWMYWRTLGVDGVYFARQAILDSPIHGPTLEPWWKLAARYRFERDFPNVPFIWDADVDGQ